MGQKYLIDKSYTRILNPIFHRTFPTRCLITLQMLSDMDALLIDR